MFAARYDRCVYNINASVYDVPGVDPALDACPSGVPAAMPDLDVDRIVRAALEVADREGAPGVTMRAVADALGVTPMALYRHVEDKAGLIALLVEAVVTERPLPAPTGDWREDLLAIARWMRQMTHAHPAVSELRRGHQVWTPSILPITERWMSIWNQSGLPLDLALRAAVATSMAIIGLVEEELAFRRLVPPPDESLAWAPNARLAFSTGRDRDADFDLIVRALVDGVADQLSDAGRRRSTA
jgi:AcrR family transcriptional regulator